MRAVDQIANTKRRLELLEFRRGALTQEEIETINNANPRNFTVKICENFLDAINNQDVEKIKADILKIGNSIFGTKESLNQIKIFNAQDVERFKSSLASALNAFSITMSFIAHAALASAIAIGGSKLLINQLSTVPKTSGEVANWIGLGAQQMSTIGEGLLMGVNVVSVLIPTLSAVYWLYTRWANEKPGDRF